MTKQEFRELLGRYLDNKAFSNERKLVEDFYDQQQENEPGWEQFGDAKKEQLKQAIYAEVLKSKNNVPTVQQSMWGYVIRVAAVLVILLGVAYLVYNQEEATIELVTKTTGPGQKATIALSDGSFIKLNANSSIEYPVTFDEAHRKVKLQGEAFFKVAEDKTRPFIVSASSLKTTVLGTSFNINAYDPANVAVALLTGSVKVNTLLEDKAGQEVYLKPGQQTYFDAQQAHFVVADFNAKAIAGWKDGIIYFKDAGYKEVFEQLAAWYNVQFDFGNKPRDEWNYSGEFKNMSLELVLNTIGYSKGFEYQIEQDVIHVRFQKDK